MTEQLPETNQSAFAAEAAAFHEVLAKGRSANQLALFDLLVSRSRDQRSPKEVEIAVLLFGNNASQDESSDSGVRVYVHRLRKKMEDYYRHREGPHLKIPKGEYRIILEGEGVQKPIDSRKGDWPQRFVATFRPLKPRWALLSAMAFIATLGLLALLFWPERQSLRIISDQANAVSGKLAVGSNPLIVVGDSMMLAETKDQQTIQRMIQIPQVRSRDDLGLYLRENPDAFYQIYDFGLNFAPIAAAEAAWALDAATPTSSTASSQTTRIIPVSALGAQTAAGRDLIFVGRLSHLGSLSDEVFSGSRFRLSAFDQLTDEQTGRQYQGQVYSVGQPSLTRDYGLLIIKSGAHGQKLIAIAGLGDMATAAIARLIASPAPLEEINRQTKESAKFEALFEITHEAGTRPRLRLIAASAL